MGDHIGMTLPDKHQLVRSSRPEGRPLAQRPGLQPGPIPSGYLVDFAESEKQMPDTGRGNLQLRVVHLLLERQLAMQFLPRFFLTVSVRTLTYSQRIVTMGARSNRCISQRADSGFYTYATFAVCRRTKA